MSLYLTYRPQNFTDVVGQRAVIQTLKNAIKAEKPAHAYLFTGSRGTGKTSSARIMAKALNCQDLQDGNPCNQCQICQDITNGSCVDIIEMDAASNTGVDNIRDLIEKVGFTPNYAKRKIYIIDEVHMLSKGAFNALLKTLEEPPEHAFFILATTELHKLPETIVSRCQTFRFERFTLEQITDHLSTIAKSEGIQAEAEALDLIARKAEGGLRDAIGLLEQIAAETEKNVNAQAVRDSLGISSSQTLEQFWNSIQSQDPSGALDILKQLKVEGRDFRTFGHDLLGFLREQMHQHLDDSQALQRILPTIEEVEKALARLKTSPIIELPFEIAVVNLCQNTSPSPAPKPIKTTVAAKPTPQVSAPVAQAAPAPSVSNPEPSEPIPSEFTAQSTPSQVSEEPNKETPIVEPTPSDNAGFIFDDDEAAQASPEPKQETQIPEPIAEVKTEEAPQEIVPPAPSISDQILSESVIKEKMKTLAETANIPSFAKRSFLGAKPRTQGSVITFTVNSAFHHEKLSATDVRIPLQQACQKLFGNGVTIDFKTEAPELASADDFLSF